MKPESLPQRDSEKKLGKPANTQEGLDTEIYSEKERAYMLSIVEEVIKGPEGKYERIFDDQRGTIRVVDKATQDVIMEISTFEYYDLEEQLQKGIAYKETDLEKNAA